MFFLYIYISEPDEEFVQEEILEYLEKLGFKVCWHHRDFDLGVPVETNIADAIVHSRRIICVISRLDL